MDIGLAISLTFGAAIMIKGILDGIKFKNLTKRGKFIILLLCSGAIYIGFQAYYTNEKNKFIDKIDSSVLEVYDTICPSYIDVQIGKNGPLFRLLGTSIYGIVGTKYSRLFKIYTKDNRLALEMVVRDDNGKAIAAITGGNWEIYNSYEYEFNGDDSAFEIVTKYDRKVFFQIDFHNKVAHIAGQFYTKKGDGIYFYEDVTDKSGSAFIKPKGSDLETPEVDIPRLFKYPRSTYSKVEGVRDNK